MQASEQIEGEFEEHGWGEQTRRSHVLSRVAFTLAGIIAAYLTIITYMMPGLTPAKIVGICAVLALVIAGFQARYDKYYMFSAITVVVVTITAGLGASLTNGGLEGYVTPILITAPAAAAIFLGARASIIASMGVVVAFIIQMVFDQMGLVDPTPYSPAVTKLGAAFMLTTATVICAVTLHTFARDAQKMIRSLVTSQHALKDSREELKSQIVELRASQTQLEQQAAQIVGLVEDLDHEKRRAEKLSVTDQLTQLSNRLQLDIWLTEAIESGDTLSVIIFDIDHFKKVNDTLGHQVGDNVLKQVAELTRQSLDANDSAGRWGGEEFLIVCRKCDLESASQRADSLRQALHDFSFDQAGRQTASFGVAQYRPGEDMDDMIKRADDALYQAKQNGRNQVVVANPDLRAAS